MSEDKTPKDKAPKVERERKNGQTRPKAGSATGLIWDIADKISSQKGRPALRNEVFDEYTKKVPNGSLGTAGTQYSRWCAFNGAGPALKKFRAEQKASKPVAEKKAPAEKKPVVAKKPPVAKVTSAKKPVTAKKAA